jgi:hypothetical protein
MKITEARRRYLFTTKIELPKDNPDDINEESDFIELREPTLEEIQGFGDDDKKNTETLKKLFPVCLVNHSFINDDGTKTTTIDVYNFLKDSSSLYSEIVEAWFKSIPFSQRLKKQQK